MALTLPKQATAADLERLSASGERYELVEGKLVLLPPANFDHGFKTMSLSIRVGAFIVQHDLGDCMAAETGFWVARDPDTVLASDFAFIRRERWPAEPPQSWGTVIPDLILETRSPSTSEREAREKMERWLDAGVKVGWDFDPTRRRLIIYRPDQTPVTLGETDTLTYEELLPGFSLALRVLFPN